MPIGSTIQPIFSHFGAALLSSPKEGVNRRKLSFPNWNSLFKAIPGPLTGWDNLLPTFQSS